MGTIDFNDDDLSHFEADGARPLPPPDFEKIVAHNGARIWTASYGSGRPVILLHGGLGHSGNWGYQLPTLVERGYRVILIDSRGHGRSSRDDQAYAYDLMVSDLLFILDSLNLEKVTLAGWSDGAVIGLLLAAQHPARVAALFFFACNVDPSGTKPFEFTEIIGRCLTRHKLDYAALSSTPDDFDRFSAAISRMQATEPNYSAADLARINVPVVVAQGEQDEFIKRAHAEYLARTLPNGTLDILPEVGHFAPLQRPAQFNQRLLRFLAATRPA